MVREGGTEKTLLPSKKIILPRIGSRQCHTAMPNVHYSKTPTFRVFVIFTFTKLNFSKHFFIKQI